MLDSPTQSSVSVPGRTFPQPKGASGLNVMGKREANGVICRPFWAVSERGFCLHRGHRQYRNTVYQAVQQGGARRQT